MTPLGLRFSVGYGDQNDSFASYLPRSGAITRQITLTDSTLPWFVFVLDEPFEYDRKQIDHFVIAARWVGHPIGDSDFTPLFVLLDPENRVYAADDFPSRDLIQTCWGEVIYATVKT
jgi:hypothetical protein